MCKLVEERCKGAAKLKTYQIALEFLQMGTLTFEQIAKGCQLIIEEVIGLTEQAASVNAG